MRRSVYFWIFSFVILALGFFLLVIKSNNVAEKKNHPVLSPGEYMAHQRMYPYDEIKEEAYLKAYREAGSFQSKNKLFDYQWEFAGPENIGGRITDIEMHPDSPNTIYLGASTGGIWKSTNNGSSWEYSFNGVNFISIGDIAIDPNNENVIYAGTGEANSSSYSFRGDGIYKSVDAGVSWEYSGLEQSAYIGRIIVDYNNPQKIFAAACGNLFTPDPERGVYRSLDGGSSWENVLFVNDSTSAIDLVQHPTDPNILYAGMWERMRGLRYRNSFGLGTSVWKTTDGGDTWNEMTNGLPYTEDAGRVGLAISQSNPEVLYAYYDMPFSEVEVYKTINGGDSWSATNTGSLTGMNSNFGWYFGQVRVNPSDEDNVYIMGVEMFKTNNGGSSWSEAVGWGVHVDHHAMFFDQVNNRILLGNDGGLYQSTNNGGNWSKINNLPFTQFYAIDIDYQNPERLIGGTQDNNTVITNTGNTDDWYPILGGDGMFCLIDYSNPNVIYAEYQWGNLYKSTDGGNNMDYIGWIWSDDRVNWSAPIAMDPENPNILYFGTYRVWKSLNGGNSWTDVSGDITKGIDQYFHTVTTIAISNLNTDIVLAGTGDGLVHISTNGGGSWTDITDGLPDRWVTRVACDPFDENTIYTTVSGFRWDEPLAHVYKSTDQGTTWNSISSDLPGLPVNDIIIDPENPGYLYVGTDAGVFFTNNGGDNWHSINEGIFGVPVMAMKMHNPSRTLVAGTYGVSMYRLNMDDLVTRTSELKKQKPQFMVFPNPFNKSLSLKGPIELVDDFRLFDADGKHIMWADKVRLNKLPELKPGIYYLHLLDKNGETLSIEKVIKK
ncbi:MAG: T9SS type A sorting domain-containing protein [Bacteroidales bacterium]|nr:T9SS type A sorting domain-containing protein [Bacteroidales bacterium]MCF8404688.1 T9SS type A sorting domain-containing protein [Bacteroidales bacterium]